jgi:hypothetical protein
MTASLIPPRIPGVMYKVDRLRSNQSEIVGEYHTRSGKIGAKITRMIFGNRRVGYSYTGEWGAGSVDLETIKKEVQYWHNRKRGMRVIKEFTP